MENSAYIISLVQNIKKHDMVSMRTIYEMYAKQMLASSFRITNSLPDSEDIIQESFLCAFQKIEQLKDEGKFSSWLKQIVINNSIKFIKNKTSFEPLDEINEREVKEDNSNWYMSIPFNQIRESIMSLPDGCREIFSLYLLEGYKHKEIASALGISISNSKSQYRYALKLLKNILMKYHHE